MNIGDKIIIQRKKLGWSQERLAEEVGVSRQAVSKWEGLGSKPEIDKVILMSKLFNVTTDYLLIDDNEEIENKQNDDFHNDTTNSSDEYLNNEGSTKEGNVLNLTIDDVNGFAKKFQDRYKMIGIGVFMCMISPIAIIGQGYYYSPMVLAFGMFWLFACIAVGVTVFIYSDHFKENEKKYKKNILEMDDNTIEYIKDMEIEEKKKKAFLVSAGVALCISSVLPIIIYQGSFLSMAFLFVILAIAVYMFIQAGSIEGLFKILLQKQEYNVKLKSEERLNKFSGNYWQTVTVIYLLYSIITGHWYISWIIWLIAPVVFNIFESMFKKKNT